VEDNDWEDIPNAKDEFDLNDELFIMQDMQCYELYKRRCKKSKKSQGVKSDMLRDHDRTQQAFLEKQLMRLRKKEEYPVGRRTQQAKKPNEVSPFSNRPTTSSQNMGMNIRQRVKQQQQ
jgi:hypothetical protein